MLKCPICSNKEENNYICGECGFDKRSDFLKNRTICSVDKEDIVYRNRIVRNKNNQNELNEMLTKIKKTQRRLKMKRVQKKLKR